MLRSDFYVRIDGKIYEIFLEMQQHNAMIFTKIDLHKLSN